MSDWLLLLLTLVFLLGVGWASLRMLPRFYEQIRLLLNLGSVREGERIVRDGIPWRVERLRVYTFLVNPMLTGGLVRLPVQDLVGLHSRPIGAGEVWFPTKRGDWVVLDDGTRGEVVVQSPDLVQLRQLGGALRTFRTVDFLGMGIRNLSEDFRVTVTFGIDYSHQAIATTQIPATMRGRLEPELRAMVGEQDFVGVKVEFHEAGSSSLDYQVLADFRGGAARDSERLRRAISRILVEACNQHGWTIPFPQLTLHRA